jgi:hypothetical protein
VASLAPSSELVAAKASAIASRSAAASSAASTSRIGSSFAMRRPSGVGS